METTAKNPIRPRILVSENPGTQVQNLSPQGIQTPGERIYHRSQGKGGERRPKGQLLPQSRLDEKTRCVSKRKTRRHRSGPNLDKDENAIKARNAVWHMRGNG